MGVNFYPWFPGDWQRKTRHLGMLERCAYRDLLDHYYATGGELRSDMGALINICGARTDEEIAAVGRVVAQFFTPDGEWLRNAKADDVLADIRERHEKRANAGKAGNAKRWGSQCDNNAIAMGSQTVSQNDRIQIQRTSKEGTSGSGVFQEGLQHLVNTGTPEREARTFLGLCLRDYEEAEVTAALRASVGAQAPIPYIRKVLASKPKKARPPKGSEAVLAKLREKWPSVRMASDGRAFYDPVSQTRFSLTGERMVGA